MIKLTITRQSDTKDCIMGYLAVNDSAVCYTLELPFAWLGKPRSIPKGVYSAFLRTEGKLGWRVELKGVADFTNVQIHIGKHLGNTEGCILLGKKVELGSCRIKDGESSKALKELEALFKKYNPKLCLDCNSTEQITVEVK